MIRIIICNFTKGDIEARRGAVMGPSHTARQEVRLGMFAA